MRNERKRQIKATRKLYRILACGSRRNKVLVKRILKMGLTPKDSLSLFKDLTSEVSTH